jgi:hypothetical protein
MKGRSIRRRVFLVFIVLLVLYSVWLGWNIRRFARFEVKLPERAGPPFEVVGVYHIHTTLSDGQRSPDTITRIAARQSLDFIILTDHGRPNRASLDRQGWKNDTLVLAGSELSTNRGHLVGLGFAAPTTQFSQNAEQAAREIEAQGGFSVIAHPFSKTRWSWGKEMVYSGLEIIDTDTMIRRNFLGALPYLPALLFKPQLYLLKTLVRPDETLKKWDKLSAEAAVSGYFSTDAHLMYSALFTCLRLHVLLDQPLTRNYETARSQVFDALRRGKFYSAVDAARPAGGFRFWAKGEGPRERLDGLIPFNPAAPPVLRAEAPFPFAFEVRLICSGETIARSAERELAYPAERPGVYRLEVYLKGPSPLSSDIPWIVSNPIYLRKETK